MDPEFESITWALVCLTLNFDKTKLLDGWTVVSLAVGKTGTPFWNKNHGFLGYWV